MNSDGPRARTIGDHFRHSDGRIVHPWSAHAPGHPCWVCEVYGVPLDVVEPVIVAEADHRTASQRVWDETFNAGMNRVLGGERP